MWKFRLPSALLALALLSSTLTAQAATVDSKAIDALGGNSLAAHHIVLQVTDSDPKRQIVPLNVATNLMQSFGTDADVEIVALGPGIGLLYANNPNAAKIKALAQQGVRFSACENSLKKATKKLGYEPALNPVAHKVPSGIVRIVNLVEAGYILVRP
ncbi:MAG TPA: DsrE family protein [Halothiobacillus sp.]|nr:DsrE family protein [Halothiobacillus sp.]